MPPKRKVPATTADEDMPAATSNKRQTRSSAKEAPVKAPSTRTVSSKPKTAKVEVGVEPEAGPSTSRANGVGETSTTAGPEGSQSKAKTAPPKPATKVTTTATKNKASKGGEPVVVIESPIVQHATSKTTAAKKSPPKKVDPVKPVKEFPYTPDRALKLFEQYADAEDTQTMTGEGMERLFADAKISLEGILPFVLAFEGQATRFGQMSKDEWTFASRVLEVDTPNKLRVKLEARNKILGTDARFDRSPTYWEDLYDFCFRYCLDPGQKSLGIDMAKAVLPLLFQSRSDVGLDFVAFLDTKDLKGLSADTWTQLGLFAQLLELGPTPQRPLLKFKEDDAWPNLMDEYAAWVQGGRPITQQ